MPTATITKNYSLPGYVTTQIVLTRSADTAIAFGGSDAPITLNGAFAVTSYAEGSPNVVTGNFPGGHGQTDGTYDFYWLEGTTQKCRRSVPVTFVINAITTTSSGTGDAFPATGAPTAVVACKQKTVAAHIDGDAVSVLWAALKFGNVAATGRGHIEFQETGGTAVGAAGIAIDGIAGGVAVAELDITGGAANSLTGNLIGLAQVTHNDTVYAPTFEMSVIQDSTP